MKRPVYLVTVTVDGSDRPTATSSKFAMNAGIRESEGLVRVIARDAGTIFEGSPPERVGDTYTRTWTPRDSMLSAVHAKVERLPD